MSSSHDGVFDTGALERELAASVEADARYHREDDMKKRAITVAPTYDDFRNMVACAHLKPLSRAEVASLG